jgi:EmrB/QacA subfamily drug resistance transporter
MRQNQAPPSAGVPIGPLSAESGTRQHYGVTLAALAVAAMAYALLQTMVAPALPKIEEDLHTSTSAVTWVLTVYLLSASVCTPIFGRLGDIFGKERMLLIVLIIFGVGCLLSGLSTSFGLLIVGRAVQGSAGAVFPLAFGIVRDEFPEDRVATGIGLISATFGIGGGAGLVLSGIIVDNISYEWIFWLGLAATVIAACMTKLYVPESPIKSPARVDWIGAVLLSAGLVCLLLGISQGNVWGWGSSRIVALFLGSAVLLIVWGRFELRARQPLVDMRLMALRAVWSTNATGLLVGFAMFGAFILIPQFVQAPSAGGYGFGATVTQAGLFLLPTAGVMLASGPAAGWLGSRYSARLPLWLGSLVAAGTFTFLAAAHSDSWQIYLASAGLGVGLGFAFAAMANLIVRAVPQKQTGEATGVNTIMRTVGGAIGGQIAATIISGHVVASGLPEESGYTAAFIVSAGVAFLAFVFALFVPKNDRNGSPPGVHEVPQLETTK